MKFVNETPFHAELLDTVLDEDRMAASIVARVTYTFGRGVLAIAEEQPWRVSRSPWDSPQGRMEQDLPFMRGGIDLFVFGRARAPGKVPVQEMQVEVRLGDLTRRARVVGERVWVRREGRLEPSAPERFVEMPLTLANAFGGTCSWDGLAVPWAENPEGKGFCVDEVQAEGAPLPNLEELDSPMTRWDERTVLCGFGFCALPNSARFKNGAVLTAQHEVQDFLPPIFNAAFPRMIALRAAAGDRLRIAGVLHGGPLDLILPAPPFRARLRFGERVEERPMAIDQIGVETEDGRLFISYRFPFKYVFRPREIRLASLVARKD